MENNIPYQVIKQITNNYDKSRILGSGGFGTVYKAVRENGETIAVKVFDAPIFDDSNFLEEFDNLKRLNHKNIVELVGCCIDTEEVVYTDDDGKQIPAVKLHTALCLEYAQNGHLGDYISDESTGPDWNTRYKIIKGVCEGLQYLREAINPPILHLDLKPQNILLGKDMIPKVADFGLSRLFGEEKTTSTCGTIGYMPPEYIDFQVISEKFDIYSLGVIMLMIITGRNSFVRIAHMYRVDYTNQVHSNWRKRLQENMVSRSLDVYCQQVRRCVELALECMKKNRQERPTIQEIVSSLSETEKMIGKLGLNIEQFHHGESRLPDKDIPKKPSQEVRWSMEYKIPYQVIKKITNNYHKDRILGSGGFGTVYKAVDENGEIAAVKVFDLPTFDDIEFQKEFDNLKRIKHENIVELLGFCNDIEEAVYTYDNGKQVPAEKLRTALCLEFVQNGHLGNYISDESKGLHWPTRYKIIKGVCNGLRYLREGINPPILHLDLKPQNILLDKDMMPKIADFGLSRFFGEEKTKKTTSNMGTIGYVPPEYTDFQVISEKFDIYSLGVIMVKIITGRDHYFKIGDVSRKEYINQVHENRKKRLRQNMTSGSVEVYCQQIRGCTELALDCLKKNRHERPTIQQIVSILNETEKMIGNLGVNIEQFPHGEFIENGSDTIRRETRESKPTTMIAPAPPKELSLDYLKKITDSFSDELVLGTNNFGTTYKGILEDGQIISVVKFASDSPVARDKLFSHTSQNLCLLNHKNLVRIVGFCHEAHNRLVQTNGRHIIAEVTEAILCYEYFPAGSLATYNFGYTSTGEASLLDWNMRFKLIVGICQGLNYLHSLSPPVIHADLKPENIFLGNNMEPKILDYGQSRIFGEEQTWINTGSFVGSVGYMAPEYLYNGEISSRSDIYSLGIVILEIVTGEINRRRLTEQKHSRQFIDKVKEGYMSENIWNMYPSLDEFHINHVEACMKIGLTCVEIDRKKRPCIEDIVDKLNIVNKEGQYYVITHELLEVHPQELCFPFEPKKTISCSLQLRNKGDDQVAFMLESETPNRYLKKLPLCGIMPHRCTYTHAITMRKQAQQKPGDLLTLHTVAVGQYDLQDVDKGSIAQEYEKYFNKAKEERHGGREVQVVTLTVNCDPLVQEQPTRPTFEIITTPDALEVSSIDVHPTEPWIMTTSKRSLHVWNYTTMETIVPFKDIINDTVHVAKFIERKKWLVAGDANGGIHVYSYDEHEEVELFDAHYSPITSLAVHPTCPFLLSSSEDEDNLIKLWDWDKNWQCTRTFQGHAENVMQVTFNSRNMGTFASASLDGTVKVWGIDEDDGDIITLDGNDGGLLCVDNFERDRDNRQHLVAGCMHKTAEIWNMEIKGCVQRLEGHAGRITVVNLHPELPILVTGSFDGTVRLWNSNTYQLDDIIDFNLGEVHAFAFIKDLKRMVVGCQQGMAIMEIPMRR